MQTALKHNDFDSYLKQKLSVEGFPVLLQFPKEFRRSWFKQFDARFMVILVLTFIIEIAIIFISRSWVKGQYSALDISSIQQRYANLLLDKSFKNDFSLDKSRTPNTYLYGIPEDIERIETAFENRAKSNNNLSDNAVNGKAGRSTGTGTTGNTISVNTGQSGFEGTGNSYGSSSSERIGSLGILGYLSENNDASVRELNEIFGPGGNNPGYLESSLANVRFNNFTQPQQGEKAESGTEAGGAAFSGLKGSKSTISSTEAQSSLSPLEKANYSIVAKNTELEESSLSILTRTGSKASARKAEHVTQVVLDHNRAIQDCYKQALKQQPDLKGKVVVRFSVTPSGKVDRIEVIKATIDYEPMIKCILNRIRGWNDFGESDISLGTVSYRQTYVFGY